MFSVLSSLFSLRKCKLTGKLYMNVKCKSEWEMYLTNSICQSESTSELNQTQECQLLSSILHSLQSNPNVRFSCFGVLSSIPLGEEPKKTQSMSQNPVNIIPHYKQLMESRTKKLLFELITELLSYQGMERHRNTIVGNLLAASWNNTLY